MFQSVGSRGGRKRNKPVAALTAFTGATTSAAGATGIVPAPAQIASGNKSAAGFALYDDGVWHPADTSAYYPGADLASGGNVGTAAQTVDNNSWAIQPQTTASQTLTLASPTITTLGRRYGVFNSGTATFTMYNTTVPVGGYIELYWDIVALAWKVRFYAGERFAIYFAGGVNFVAPSTQLWITGCASGGGGGGGGTVSVAVTSVISSPNAGGGGGGGAWSIRSLVTAVIGTSYSVSIGSGGGNGGTGQLKTNGITAATVGGNGSGSSLGAIWSANGGSGGGAGSGNNGATNNSTPAAGGAGGTAGTGSNQGQPGGPGWSVIAAVGGGGGGSPFGSPGIPTGPLYGTIGGGTVQNAFGFGCGGAGGAGNMNSTANGQNGSNGGIGFIMIEW